MLGLPHEPTDRLPIIGKGGVVVGWTLVDPEDYQRFRNIKWRFLAKDRKYASMNKRNRQTKKRHTTMLHRLIMDAPKGMQVDHISHDILDNRKANLRICSASENQMNRKGPNKTGTSGFLGVSWNKDATKWRASIKANGKTICLGEYDFIVDAIEARDKAAAMYFGDFAWLNVQPFQPINTSDEISKRTMEAR